MASDTFVKICGINDDTTMRHASALASATGIVVDPDSRRYVPPEQARILLECATAPAYIVTRTTSIAEWDELMVTTGAQYAQVHADDGNHVVAHLHERYGARVIQSFTVPHTIRDKEACARRIIDAMSACEADLLLLDSGAGTGTMHDHDVSHIIAKEHDIILAGGLSSNTITDVLAHVDPWGVDVSSGVELNGKKDIGTITEFIELIRNGGESL